MRKKHFIIMGSLFIAVASFVGMHAYREHFHENIRRLPQQYVYDDFSGTVNPAFFVESEGFTDELLAYYQQIENDAAATPYFKFPVRTLPQYDRVYVMRYLGEDSLIAEVYSYYKSGNWYDGNLRGFVYAGTLHNHPPSKAE